MTLRITALPLPLTVNDDGAVQVTGTRVPLEAIVGAFAHGATAEGIAQQYPTVALADVYAIVAYYLRHTPEVDDYMARRQRVAYDVRSRNEARSSPAGIRDRLLARARGNA